MDGPSIEPVSRERWRELAPTFQDYNYRQMWDYGEALAARRGARCEHVAIRHGGAVVALADVRIKRLPVVGGGIAYISGGPLARRGGAEDAASLRLALMALQEEYTRRRRHVLRILAPLGDAAWNALARGALNALGFGATAQSAGYRTMAVDLARPLTEVRARLAQKWRNCLNAAERKGLTVCSGTDDGLWGRFCGLFETFHRRKGFAVDLDAAFYRGLQGSLDEPERLTVSLAEREGKPLAGHVCSMLGDTCVYMLGATDEEGLKSKAAYLLQWQAIAAAHARGLRWYDLGGIDPEENPSVYHFKEGMGGEDLTSAGPAEYAKGGWKMSMTVQAERIYRQIKGAPARAARGGREAK